MMMRCKIFGFAPLALAAIAVMAPPAAPADSPAAATVTVVERLALSEAADGRLDAVERSGGVAVNSPIAMITANPVLTDRDNTLAKVSFRLSGAPNQAYAISTPSAAMSRARIDTFAHDAGTTPVLDADGTGQFKVRTKLNVGWNRVSSPYIIILDVIVSNY